MFFPHFVLYFILSKKKISPYTGHLVYRGSLKTVSCLKQGTKMNGFCLKHLHQNCPQVPPPPPTPHRTILHRITDVWESTFSPIENALIIWIKIYIYIYIFIYMQDFRGLWPTELDYEGQIGIGSPQIWMWVSAAVEEIIPVEAIVVFYCLRLVTAAFHVNMFSV